MQQIEWTTGLVVIAGVIGFGLIAIGHLLATAFQSAKAARLTTELDQCNQLLNQANSHSLGAQQDLKRLETVIHQKELAESALQGELNSSLSNAHRLRDDLKAYKDELSSLREVLESIRSQHHATETLAGRSQEEIRSLKEQSTELRERLAESAQSLLQERDQVSILKDSLAQEGKAAKALEISEKEVREQLREAKEGLQDQIANFQQLQNQYHTLSNEHTELKTTLEKTEEHFKQQLEQLSDTKNALTKEFENLANRIFEEKGKTFTQSNQSSMDIMLKPFREQIEAFQKRVNEVHDASIQGNTSLNAEIKRVLDIGLQMSKEATNLTSALKGDSQQRGAWGEAQLRRTLEMSGLVENTHYDVQSSFRDSDGRQKQTDYLVKLPDGKHIVIDSKVSLNAYDRAVSAESPEHHQLAMEDHIKAVRKHIDDLASKDYTNLVGIHSPSFVLMFMSIEPAYIEALKNHKDLFEYGYRKGVVLVSHTTLIPILRTVSNLWMLDRSNTEAREISEKAGDIYNQVCIVAERLSKLGGTLGTVSNHYNSVVTALAGQQGLYGKVDRFNQLSAKVSKSLPQLEPSHMDFETERLSLIIEPVIEESVAQTTPSAETHSQHDGNANAVSTEAIALSVN